MQRSQLPEHAGEIFDSAQEADHRIGNNLALIAGSIRRRAGTISKQTSGFTNREVELLLAEIAGRIDAVARLHEILSQSPGDAERAADIAEHLAKMCTALRPFISSAGPVELSYDSTPNCIVAPDQIMPISIIVSEMVMNAIKYAHPAGVAGRVDVSCHADDEAIIVKVCDDGVGLPEVFDASGDSGLGFRVVRTLAAQLGATPIFESDAMGLRFTLTVPKAR
jgi:two-component sensor histidine kinase